MTILLVDDDEGVCAFVERVLNGQGHCVLTFGTAEDALGHALQNHIDVLIADMALPGMTGVVLAHWLSSREPALPVVLTSGYPHNRDLAEVSRYGWQVLPKPFKPYDLISAIERARYEASRRGRTSG